MKPNDEAPEVCPRCQTSYIPNNSTPGAYPGALSRIDNETYICSACGEDEAIGGLGAGTGTLGHLVPIEEWPTQLTYPSLLMQRAAEFARARMENEEG